MIPVTVLSSVDPVLREVTAFGAVIDHPGTVVALQDLDPVAGTLRRVVSDVTGVIEDETVALQHVCLGCAIREDSLPALELIAGSGRWERILWGLPVSAGAAPLTTALHGLGAGSGVRLAGSVAVVDLDTVVDDVFGDELLVDRRMALTRDDRRSVGEALVNQVRHADLVVRHGAAADGTGRLLVDHLRGAGSVAAAADDVTDLFLPRYDPLISEGRLDPLQVCRAQVPDSGGVWSLDLHSPRPFHPDRLMAVIEQLGATDLCSRGRFSLPGRPGAVHGWDGAGGQLSVGDTELRAARPSTRLVYTGIGDHQRREQLTRIFRRALLTDGELRTADRFLGIDDGFDPWLGEFRLSA